MAKKATKKKATKKGRGAADEGVDQEIAGALALLDENWGEVEEQEGGDFEDVPEGKYAVRINKTKLGPSKSSGRFQCSWDMTIVEGDYANRRLFKHDGLEDETNLGWMRTTLARLGMEWPESATDLPATLEELHGTFAQVTVKHRGDFVNTYFDKALDDDEVNADGLDEVEEEEVEGEEEESTNYLGYRVSVDYDGEPYEGEIVASFEDGTQTVKFDDGTKADHDVSECTFLEEEEAEEEETENEEEVDEGEEEVEHEETEEEGVTLEFDDEKITEAMQDKITAVATEHEFEPDDYDTWADLLGDVAEYLGITGSFKTATPLIKACQTAEAPE